MGTIHVVAALTENRTHELRVLVLDVGWGVNAVEAIGVYRPPVPRHGVEIALQPVVLEASTMARPNLVHCA